MSDLFGNHTVGFPTRRLICCVLICGNTCFREPEVAAATQTVSSGVIVVIAILAIICSVLICGNTCFREPEVAAATQTVSSGVIVVIAILAIICCVLAGVLMWICNRHGCCVKIGMKLMFPFHYLHIFS